MGRTDVVKALLSKGAEVNATDGDNETALMRAAEKGGADIAKMLLNAGAKQWQNPNDRPPMLPLDETAYGGTGVSPVD